MVKGHCKGRKRVASSPGRMILWGRNVADSKTCLIAAMTSRVSMTTQKSQSNVWRRNFCQSFREEKCSLLSHRLFNNSSQVEPFFNWNQSRTKIRNEPSSYLNFAIQLNLHQTTFFLFRSPDFYFYIEFWRSMEKPTWPYDSKQKQNGFKLGKGFIGGKFKIHFGDFQLVRTVVRELLAPAAFVLIKWPSFLKRSRCWINQKKSLYLTGVFID